MIPLENISILRLGTVAYLEASQTSLIKTFSWKQLTVLSHYVLSSRLRLCICICLIVCYSLAPIRIAKESWRKYMHSKPVVQLYWRNKNLNFMQKLVNMETMLIDFLITRITMRSLNLPSSRLFFFFKIYYYSIFDFPALWKNILGTRYKNRSAKCRMTICYKRRISNK